MSPRKKAARAYRTDTFREYQEREVKQREQNIHECLELLGKNSFKFGNITKLAEHLSQTLEREGKPCHPATLLRKTHTKDGVKVLNPYRLLLQKYEMGKYFGKGQNMSVTAEDIAGIRRKYPAVDAYCALKEGEAKNLKVQVAILTKELERRQKGTGLLRDDGRSGSLPEQLSKTVTALKQLLDEASEFYKVDWQRRAIVDLSSRDPKVVVGPDLLGPFFEALANSGLKPSEGV